MTKSDKDCIGFKCGSFSEGLELRKNHLYLNYCHDIIFSEDMMEVIFFCQLFFSFKSFNRHVLVFLLASLLWNEMALLAGIFQVNLVLSFGYIRGKLYIK